MAALKTGLAIGVDIGGSKIAGGLVDGRGRILHRIQRPTPADDTDKLLHTVADVIAEMRPAHPSAEIGIGVAGLVDQPRGLVAFAPHLPLRDIALQDLMKTRHDMAVLVDNDATLAAWGEQQFGASKGCITAVMVTVGTGIGGCVNVAGESMAGASGMAGEFGHMVIEPDGWPCPCGNTGCWEQYASGAALARLGRTAAGRSTALGRSLLLSANGNADAISGLMIGQAARAGDQEAGEYVAEVGRWLGLGLANLSAAFDPDVIVVGGGLSALGELLLQPARTALREHLLARPHRRPIPVHPAELGPDAGLIGAADMARKVGL